jgi:uncharacterized protein YjbJ (UPF0337 family)
MLILKRTESWMEDSMNWEQIQGQWKDIKGQARSMWGKLTDDDIESIAGRKDQLLGKLQERYGYSKEKAESIVDDFSKKLKLNTKKSDR